MSWNKKSFNDKRKNPYRRDKEKVDVRNLDADNYHPNDWNLYPDKPFYAWNDCSCCPPEAYTTMHDIRRAFLIQMIRRLGVKTPYEYEDEIWYF